MPSLLQLLGAPPLSPGTPREFGYCKHWGLTAGHGGLAAAPAAKGLEPGRFFAVLSILNS